MKVITTENYESKIYLFLYAILVQRKLSWVLAAASFFQKKKKLEHNEDKNGTS